MAESCSISCRQVKSLIRCCCGCSVGQQLQPQPFQTTWSSSNSHYTLSSPGFCLCYFYCQEIYSALPHSPDSPHLFVHQDSAKGCTIQETITDSPNLSYRSSAYVHMVSYAYLYCLRFHPTLAVVYMSTSLTIFSFWREGLSFLF